MNKNKLIIIFVCIMLLLASCGGKEAEITESSSESKQTQTSGAALSWDIMKNVDETFPVEQYVKDEKEKWNIGRNVEFTWYFNYNHHYCTKPWTEYEALKIAADITGINVTGTIPTGDPSEKVRLMMATNELPDFVTLGYGDPLGLELIEGGYVYCLDDLISEYVPEFKNEIPSVVRDSGIYEDIDGKMWSISGVTLPEWLLKEKKDPSIGNFSYNVRKDLWKALGEPSIATPDELYNTLKLFKKTYPTLNGKTSIGISGYATGVGAMMTIGYSFGIYDNYYDEATKICTLSYFNPNYPEFIAYMNKLYREGLMDPEIFIKDDQKVIEDLSTCAFMMPYVWHAADPANAVLNAKDPESHFIAIPPMSATGKPFAFPGASRIGGAVETFVTKKCKDPEAAVKLIRYGFSPTGTMQICQGTPGIHYYVENGVYYRPEKLVDEINKDPAAFNNRTGIWDYYSLWYQPMPGKRSDSPDRVKYDIPNSVPYAFDSTIMRYKMTPSGSTDAGVALATILTIANNATRAIAAPTAEESAQIIEKMLKDIRNTKDYDKLEKFMTERYTKNLERFGGPLY